ncbi:MAG: hypothetical protein [Caudoviricetes sp.]|nr:MAG: hypothetical protein [Caudoviricetes sp.]
MKKYKLVDQETLEHLIAGMHKLNLLELDDRDNYPEYEKNKEKYFYEVLDLYEGKYDSESAFDIIGEVTVEELFSTIDIDLKGTDYADLLSSEER